MRLPSSSSFLLTLLASLVVSSSSLSALAAPVGDRPEGSSSYAPAVVLLAVLLHQQHAPIPPSSDTTMAQPNNHLQTRNLMDKVTVPLAVPPELGKAIPDILHAILDPLVGKDTPKARGEMLDLVKIVAPAVKITWAEEVDEGGDDATSEDSSMRPSPAAGHQGAPVIGPNPPAGFLSQPSLPPRGHARRQVTAGSGEGEGGSNGGPGGNVPSPPGCPP